MLAYSISIFCYIFSSFFLHICIHSLCITVVWFQLNWKLNQNGMSNQLNLLSPFPNTNPSDSPLLISSTWYLFSSSFPTLHASIKPKKFFGFLLSHYDKICLPTSFFYAMLSKLKLNTFSFSHCHTPNLDHLFFLLLIDSNMSKM